mmetsp:Transcript_2610/g.9743  ORF Transcript_2610/g.9743 Transcript_2610/m.9743 type:complete len:91 (+) Transcript_2610:135-407(+)
MMCSGTSKGLQASEPFNGSERRWRRRRTRCQKHRARPELHVPSVSRVARRVMSTHELVPVPGRLKPSLLLEALVTACALEAVRWDFAEKR